MLNVEYISSISSFAQVIINMGRDGRPDGSANAVFETARDAKRVVSFFFSCVLEDKFLSHS